MREWVYLFIAAAVCFVLGVGAECVIFALVFFALTRSGALLWLLAPAGALISDILYTLPMQYSRLGIWLLFGAALLRSAFRGNLSFVFCTALMCAFILTAADSKYFIPAFLAIIAQINAKSYLLAQKNLI